jgi:hypothetical protein
MGLDDRLVPEEALPAGQEATPRAAGSLLSDRLVPEQPSGEPTARITVPLMPNDPALATVKEPDIGRTEAGRLGYSAGASANFGDEVYGLSQASGLPDWMGGYRAPVGAVRMLYNTVAGSPDSPFMQQYNEAVTQRRGEQARAERQYPGTYLTGEAVGSILPTARAGILPQGATLGQRAAAAARVSGAYGAASGVGAGTNDADRLLRGAIGGGVGTAVGAATPAVADALAGAANRFIAEPTAKWFGTVFNPTEEAARRVARTIQTSAETDPGALARMTAQQFMQNRAAGSPAMVMDLGAGPTRALGRAAADYSPEAEQVLSNAINPRFEAQSNRFANWLRQNTNYPNAHAQQQALTEAASAANNPAYRQAYAAGAGSVHSTELERLAASKTVANAMRTAASKAEDEAVLGGYGAMNPRVTFTPDGQVQFQHTPAGIPIFPDLQFWDLTRRELSSSATAAARAGNDTEARRLGGFARMLNTELDKVVPEYGTARSTAAHFFGADNALEAGQKFVGAGKRSGQPGTGFPLDEARTAIAQMSPMQRQLFQDGYATALINKVRANPDRRSLVNKIAESPAARDEMAIALGPQRARDFLNFLHGERVMDFGREAIQGNSKTTRFREQAKNLIEMAPSYAPLALGAGAGWWNQSPEQLGYGAAASATVAGKRALSNRMSQRIAEHLVSQDPTAVMRNQITHQMLTNQAARRRLMERGLTGAAVSASQPQQ